MKAIKKIDTDIKDREIEARKIRHKVRDWEDKV